MLWSLPRLSVLIAVALGIGTLCLPYGDGAKAQSPPCERGKLRAPVAGEQVRAFGQPTEDGSPSKAVVIRAMPGAAVVAPCDGTIVYAGEFRSYGNLVIISAGSGYHVLLSGLSLVDVQPGQHVLAGKPVGTLPYSTADGRGPTLHFGLHKNQQPIDPESWLRDQP